MSMGATNNAQALAQDASKPVPIYKRCPSKKRLRFGRVATDIPLALCLLISRCLSLAGSLAALELGQIHRHCLVNGAGGREEAGARLKGTGGLGRGGRGGDVARARGHLGQSHRITVA